MAGDGIATTTKGGKEYPGKLTGRVLLTCMVAATGGLIFGYDLGVSGTYITCFMLMNPLTSRLYITPLLYNMSC